MPVAAGYVLHTLPPLPVPGYDGTPLRPGPESDGPALRPGHPGDEMRISAAVTTEGRTARYYS